MLQKLIVGVVLLAGVATLCATTAGAVTIDPGLQSVLDQKAASELVPVLMIFDGADRPALDENALQNLTFDARRQTVISKLRADATTLMQRPLSLLTDPQTPGVATRVTTLYLARAISFRADRAMIDALAADTQTHAVLVDDRSLSLAAMTDTRIGQTPDLPATKADRADTVWNVRWIHADQVWNQLGYTGSGVLVGHLDTGVWLAHPDLTHHIYHNPGEIAGNGIDDDGNGFVDDYQGWDFGDWDNNPNDDNPSGGHGTHTAGTVCGDGSAGTQTGVAPGAMLLVCKVFDSAGNGTVSMIWQAEQYGVEMGVRLFTMSLGVSGSDIPPTLLRAERTNCEAIREAGVAFFNSAGNDHFAYNPPYEVSMTARVPAPWFADASVPFSSTGGIVTVGGTGYQNNSVYSFSSQGPVTWSYVDPFDDWPYNPGAGLIKPDIAAPGTNVNSTVRGGGYSGNTWSGTSMACPHLAGVAALMLQKNPSLSPESIDAIIEQSALDLGITGKDNVFGSGLVDAYQAVQHTSTAQVANLIETAVLPDPDGDQVLDPGQVSPLAFELTNNSPLVVATVVHGTLTVAPNAYVTVVDGSADFPDIPAGLGTGTNVGDPFTLNVDSRAPQGFAFTMYLTVTCDGGFTRTFDVDYFAGLPEYLTHDAGSVFGTVTDQGIIGYMDDSQTEGDGFGLAGGSSALYLGSFWGGSSASYICNRDYPGQGAGLETYEWVTRLTPNGRMRNEGAADGADQTFACAFTDSGHASPRDMLVEQTSFAWTNSPNDQFVILQYHLTNRGSTSIPSYWMGIFCDWDISPDATDQGGTDVPRNAIYLHPASGGSYYGLTSVGDAPAANVTLVNNPTYVYPNAAILDANKIAMLDGAISVPSAPTSDDWSMVCSVGPYSFAPGEDHTVAFAMVYGATLQEFLDNVDAAKAVYNPATPVTEGQPVKVFQLVQNAPNPFNPRTTLKYEVAAAGPVSLVIYDVHGQRVRTLVDAVLPAGRHEVTWDGNDQSGQQVAAGVYVARYSAGGQQQSRKLTLVK